jgi:hypothetical protein
MMLMKLLRTTNMLSEAKDQPHRFKVREGALPKFGNTAEPAVKNFNGASEERVKVETVQRPTKAVPSGGWAQKLNPFATQGAPVPRAAVQGELSLDNVKPLRNDLSDTDLELVAAVRKPEVTPESVKIGSMEIPVVKGVLVWDRLRGWIRRLRP